MLTQVLQSPRCLHFEGDEFSIEEIRAALRTSVMDGSIVPVGMGSNMEAPLYKTSSPFNTPEHTLTNEYFPINGSTIVLNTYALFAFAKS